MAARVEGTSMAASTRRPATGPRWKQRPPGSNWGDFGPDDQRGRLNLLTPEQVRKGIAEVREGIPFCLSLPLDLPGGNLLNPRRFPPVLRPTMRNGKPNLNYRMADDDPSVSDVMNDAAVILHTQYSTQWDSLCHVGQLFTTTASSPASTSSARWIRLTRAPPAGSTRWRRATRGRSASRTWPRPRCRGAAC